MRKIVLLSLMFLLVFFLSCAVGQNTGAIRVANISNRDSSSIKIGNTYIGFATKGQNYTVYFYTGQDDAVITVGGFEKPATVYDYETAGDIIPDGKIDLKTNYLYTMTLQENSGEYTFQITGSKSGVNYPENDFSDYINMK